MGLITDVLGGIICLVQNIGYAVLWALCEFLNLVFVVVGGTIGWVVSLLPLIPDEWGTLPPNVIGAINWLIPVGQITLIFLGFLFAYGMWLAIKVIANWMKVTP